MTEVLMRNGMVQFAAHQVRSHRMRGDEDDHAVAPVQCMGNLVSPFRSRRYFRVPPDIQAATTKLVTDRCGFFLVLQTVGQEHLTHESPSLDSNRTASFLRFQRMPS